MNLLRFVLLSAICIAKGKVFLGFQHRSFRFVSALSLVKGFGARIEGLRPIGYLF